jgi:hypothetical protein
LESSGVLAQSFVKFVSLILMLETGTLLPKYPKVRTSPTPIVLLPSAEPRPANRAMKSKIEALGRIRKEFPPRGNVQLFQLDKPATFTCSLRKVEASSKKVALDLRTGDLLSNGADGQLLANQ